MNTIKFSLVGAAVVVALFGCNSDSNTITTTTPVTLSVSDAPIDDVSEVVITYSKVAFLPLDGGSPQILRCIKPMKKAITWMKTAIQFLMVKILCR